MKLKSEVKEEQKYFVCTVKIQTKNVSGTFRSDCILEYLYNFWSSSDVEAFLFKPRNK